jgi:hypothetical protein
MTGGIGLFCDDKDCFRLNLRNCSQRGTDIPYGRVDDGGLRCLYQS